MPIGGYMPPRSELNIVKFRVREYALRLRRFIVAELVEETGLNPSSVRTELDRMIKEGLLTAQVASPEDYPGLRRRGGQPKVYQLNPDPLVRIDLWKSVKAFFGPPPAPTRPTAPHYGAARQLIDEALAADNENRRKQLLAQAEDDLETTYQAEGASLAPERVRALIEYERARIAFWRGEYQRAETLFESLLQSFRKWRDDNLAGIVQEFLLLLKNQHLLSTAGEPRGQTRHFLDTLKKNLYRTDSPVTLISLRLNQNLADEQIMEEINRSVISVSQELAKLREEIGLSIDKRGIAAGMPGFDSTSEQSKPRVTYLSMVK